MRITVLKDHQQCQMSNVEKSILFNISYLAFAHMGDRYGEYVKKYFEKIMDIYFNY